VCRVSFIVCVVLCAVFCLSVVLFCVMFVICALCRIVVPLSLNRNPFAFKINNNKRIKRALVWFVHLILLWKFKKE
jgi:heme/copper-type cytochrome/quinol oxidase subunit 1